MPEADSPLGKVKLAKLLIWQKSEINFVIFVNL